MYQLIADELQKMILEGRSDMELEQWLRHAIACEIGGTARDTIQLTEAMGSEVFQNSPEVF